jgi:hypothetical protein
VQVVASSGNGASSGMDAMNRAIGSKIKLAAESYAAEKVTPAAAPTVVQ